ncbi:MAG: bifunctional adenosylcobinamide kinase/adenosylcobinamide-phosphate guanylyltransferase [Selenomonadales bacterium]|jgi:adenosylcobinamide kinase/adenosylcobinamide-phosphate guanylyltransferase|nr:bifunctional adenosylcobinamide kinase/adenosylcobinamide-phosphate guanylyltransferase [Selenomonadales bacterium]
MGRITLVTGGVRSGKSALAEAFAMKARSVVYLATCEANDEEMRDRISLHQARRPAHWTTEEVPLDLPAAITRQDPETCLLIDCLGLWVSNHLLADEENNVRHAQEFIEKMNGLTCALLEELSIRPGEAILVTNEVGFGLVPPYKLGRIFRDCLGLVNAQIATSAEDVYLCVAGMPVTLKKDGVVRLG